jgi:uncharacterized SAM-binding protein YcdF (DUF218 family)
MYWVSKIVSRVFFPLPLTLEILLAGFLLCAWKRTRRIGVCVVALGIVTLLCLSTPILSKPLLLGLETRYPALDVATLDRNQPYLVCVPGVGYDSRRGFSDEFYVRMQEAGRIAETMDKTGLRYTLVVSLHNPRVPKTEKLAVIRAYLKLFGVSPDKVDAIDEARDSAEEMHTFAQRPGRLIVVSNAFHMPRLMLLAKHLGTNAIPAPVGWNASDDNLTILDFGPSEDALRNSRIAVYEYLGMCKEEVLPTRGTQAAP